MLFIGAFVSTSSTIELASSANLFSVALGLGKMSGLRLFSFSFAFACLGAVLAQPTFPEGIDQIVSGIGARMEGMKLPEGCFCCAQCCW